MTSHFIETGGKLEGSPESVCWIDIMGIKNIFEKSNKTASIHILRLHKIANNFIDKLDTISEINYYPINDGFFLTSKSNKLFIELIINIFIQLAKIFLEQPNLKFKFMIRAGVSYGNIVHGSSFDSEVNYAHRLIFGKPIIDAYNAESMKSPFSINIHENYRNKYQNLSVKLEEWYKLDGFNSINFANEVRAYLNNYDSIPNWIPYKNKEEHLELFNTMISTI